MNFLLIAASMLAAAPIDQAAVQDAGAAPEDKTICRKLPPKTGTIMTTNRVCRTKVEWTQIERHGSKHAQDMLDNRKTTTQRPDNGR